MAFYTDTIAMRKVSGFTLIEILISTAIGAIVALAGAYTVVQTASEQKRAENNFLEARLVEQLQKSIVLNSDANQICQKTQVPGASQATQRPEVLLTEISKIIAGDADSEKQKMDVRILGVNLPTVTASKVSLTRAYLSDWARISRTENSAEVWRANLYAQFSSDKPRQNKPMLVGALKVYLANPSNGLPTLVNCDEIPQNGVNVTTCLRRGFTYNPATGRCQAALEPESAAGSEACTGDTRQTFVGIDLDNKEVCRSSSLLCAADQFLIGFWSGRPFCSDQQNAWGGMIPQDVGCHLAIEKATAECVSVCRAANFGEVNQVCEARCKSFGGEPLGTVGEDYSTRITQRYSRCQQTVINASQVEYAPNQQGSRTVVQADANKCLCGTDSTNPQNWIDDGNICASCYEKSNFDASPAAGPAQFRTVRMLKTSICTGGSFVPSRWPPPRDERPLLPNELTNIKCNGELFPL